MSIENTTFGIADLDVQDDLSVAMDNETYQDQANPAPPVAGNYMFQTVTIKPRTNKEGHPIFEGNDPRYPLLNLQTVEIVDGLGDGVTRKVAIFQDVKTKPFQRSGFAASNLGDLTRAYGSESWQGIPEGISRLKEAFETKATFGAQLDWGVYDSEFIKAALDVLGLANVKKDERTEDQKKVLNAIYKAGRITGQRFFPFNPETGKFSHVMVRENVTFKNPVTGANVTVEVPKRTLEGRATLTRYYAKTEVEAGHVNIGPAKVKPQAIAA